MTVEFFDDRRSLADFYTDKVVADVLEGRTLQDLHQQTDAARMHVK